jgi:hypothetical protein
MATCMWSSDLLRKKTIKLIPSKEALGSYKLLQAGTAIRDGILKLTFNVNSFHTTEMQ